MGVEAGPALSQHSVLGVVLSHLHVVAADALALAVGLLRAQVGVAAWDLGGGNTCWV